MGFASQEFTKLEKKLINLSSEYCDYLESIIKFAADNPDKSLNHANSFVISLMRDLKQEFDVFTKTLSATVGSTRMKTEEIIQIIENITTELASVKNDVKKISKYAAKGKAHEQQFWKKSKDEVKKIKLNKIIFLLKEYKENLEKSSAQLPRNGIESEEEKKTDLNGMKCDFENFWKVNFPRNEQVRWHAFWRNITKRFQTPNASISSMKW